MGSSVCIKACPEQSVLEVIEGSATIVQGSHCVGHGACERACPVDAIKLVFGSEKRGIDLPQVRPDSETRPAGSAPEDAVPWWDRDALAAPRKPCMPMS